MKRFHKIILIVLAVAILAVAAYGIFYKLPGRTVSWGNAQTTGENVGNFFKNLFTKNEISVVVFGRAGGGYIGGGLADAILVARFDPDTNTVHLVSLPRDLWISDDSEQFKINEVFNKNKVPAVMDEIRDITGIEPNGYVVVDLNMLKQVVDWLGGVDVVLREPATDWVSGYTLPAGPHHLNGEDAIWLVRNRYNKQGDFFRESNQHQVLGSMLEKFQQLDKEQKNSFLKTFVFRGSFLQNVQVDFARLTPYLFGTDVSQVQFRSVVLDFTTKLFTTTAIPYQTVATTTYISALLPTAGFENYKDIRAYIEEKIKE
jgi:LCP family protein required for cell wall assembly